MLSLLLTDIHLTTTYPQTMINFFDKKYVNLAKLIRFRSWPFSFRIGTAPAVDQIGTFGFARSAILLTCYVPA